MNDISVDLQFYGIVRGMICNINWFLLSSILSL